MKHLIVYICPPIAVMLDGKLITGLVMFPIWALSAILIIPHLIFIAMAWRIIDANQSRRQHRQTRRDNQQQEARKQARHDQLIQELQRQGKQPDSQIMDDPKT